MRFILGVIVGTVGVLFFAEDLEKFFAEAAGRLRDYRGNA